MTIPITPAQRVLADIVSDCPMCHVRLCKKHAIAYQEAVEQSTTPEQRVVEAALRAFPHDEAVYRAMGNSYAADVAAALAALRKP